MDDSDQSNDAPHVDELEDLGLIDHSEPDKGLRNIILARI